MSNQRERDMINNGDDFDDSSSVDSGSNSSHALPADNAGSRSEAGLTERLVDILVEEGDGDLLIQDSNREDRLLQWLQALDMQFLGACRADERLKPLLKMNAACGFAEDPLLTQLSQHFEPSEVGMLARCFCVPLVSIRVGKINKEGTLLCPTAIRGNLTLVLLPSSDLRLSFIGDDGKIERIFTITDKLQCSAVLVDEIPTDSSGRSFLVRAPNNRPVYFWCSEKSKLLGVELLGKMKDLIKKKPSIAELSGISKSRLDCFASHLRAFLVGSTESSVCVSSSADSTASSNYASENSQPSSKFSRSRHSGGLAGKGDPAAFQSILSPRSSSFKEAPARIMSSHRIAAREKIKRRGDSHHPAVDNFSNDITNNLDLSSTSANDRTPEVTENMFFSPSSFLESLGKLDVPSSLGQAGKVPSVVPPLFSPYYCWCPSGIPTCPSLATLTQSPDSSIKSFPPPSGVSLLPNTLSSSLLEPVQPLNINTSMNFPPFMPDPLVRMSLPTSQQILTFTPLPLMCDPIVHVPVIDVCSSGQGYLVSAGPAMSTTIPPLHPKLVNPLIPESDAVVKGARETLRLLMSGSSQSNQQQVMMDPLPAILTNPDEKQPNILVAGSRGLYTGTRDINVIANSIAAMGLVSLSGVNRVDGEADSDVSDKYGILDQEVKKPSDSGGAFSGDKGMPSFESMKE